MTQAHQKYASLDQSFNRIAEIGEGAFGKVYLGEILKEHQDYLSANISENMNSLNIGNKNTQNTAEKQSQQFKFYALKKLRPLFKKGQMLKETKIEDFPEVKILKQLSHPNLISLKEVLEQQKQYEKNHYLIMQYGIEIMNLFKHKQIMISKEMMRSIVKQIVEGIYEMHRKGIIHRDVKPSNIFLMRDGTIKVGDFSISRAKPLEEEEKEQEIKEEQWPNSKGPMTPNVTTRYYRAPQIIYGSRNYNQSIDIWGLACTLAQLLLHQPIFPGNSDIHQLELVFSIIGVPQQLWPDAKELPFYLEFDGETKAKGLDNVLPDHDSELRELIKEVMVLDPKKRLRIEQIRSHSYLKNVQQKAKQELSKICVYLTEKKIQQIKLKTKK